MLTSPPSFPPWLQGHALQPGEVLLSSGSYHSPMHLITGEFWLGFPGRAQRRRPGQGAAHPAGGTAGERQPSYVCRRAFDAAAVAVVPLRRALEGFMAAM